MFVGALAALGGVLERLGASWRRLGDVLEPSWSRLGAAAAFDAAFDAAAAASKRSWIDLKLLRSALVSILSSNKPRSSRSSRSSRKPRSSLKTLAP